MPAIDTSGGESCRLERFSGRTFWFLWATIILISAAFYYEKAADIEAHSYDGVLRCFSSGRASTSTTRCSSLTRRSCPFRFIHSW